MDSTKSYRIFTVIAALIIFWMFLGQLVNFHQEHVLGKYLPAQSTHFIKPKSSDDHILVLDDIATLTLSVDLEAIEECSSFFTNLPTAVIVSEDVSVSAEEILITQHVSSLPPPVC